MCIHTCASCALYYGLCNFATPPRISIAVCTFLVMENLAFYYFRGSGDTKVSQMLSFSIAQNVHTAIEILDTVAKLPKPEYRYNARVVS